MESIPSIFNQPILLDTDMIFPMPKIMYGNTWNLLTFVFHPVKNYRNKIVTDSSRQAFVKNNLSMIYCSPNFLKKYKKHTITTIS